MPPTAKRADLKQESLERILNASATRIRQEGLTGSAIGPVMQDAGLTHGAFYAHFANKDELCTAAFRHALKDNRTGWIGQPKNEPWRQRLSRLAKRYLTPKHLDNLAGSCALASLASDAGRSNPGFRQTYEQELEKSLAAICNHQGDIKKIAPEKLEDAIALMALCVGGITLARAVNSHALSQRILSVCQAKADTLATDS